MPEINQEIKNETKSTPQFILPQRRSYIKYVAIPVVVIVVLACAWIAYAMFSQPAAVVTPEPQPTPEPVVKSDSAFYLTTEFGNETTTETTMHLYEYSPDSRVEDKKIVDIKEQFFNILTKHPEANTYIASAEGNKVLLLNAATGKMDLLFELAEAGLFREVSVSEDKKWLAYARNYEGSENGKSGGEIWLYNFETKEHKELVKKTELGLYQGFSILGWRDNDTELIVNDLGGDAGATWGDIYQVNVATGVVVKVNPVAEKNKMQFLRGSLSPDGDRWLYQHCETPDPVDAEAFDIPACISGTELRVYDFETKQIKTVYQNLRYDNNADKNILRTIMSFMWEDDNNIIAAVPGAFLDISSGNGKVEEIYLFDRTNPQNFKNHFIQLQSATQDRIVFSENGETWKVFDPSTEKVVSLTRDSTKQYIVRWLD